ncbi:MAG: serine hydrolase domain-containing protein [Acidobacteriota bacterium]
MKKFALILILSLALSTSAQTGLPDTPASKKMAAMLEVIESGDGGRALEFIRAFAKSFLEEFSEQQHLSIFEQVHNRHGGFEIASVERSEQFEIEVTARAKRTGEYLKIRLATEPAPPHAVRDIGFRGTDAPGKSADTRTASDEEIRKRLDDYLSRLAQFGFSGAVLVARGDEIFFNKAYGMADKEKRIPNTASTVFSTGSITKQFTAAAILKLEMQGRLSIADSISKYLDRVPDDKKAITLHQLLTHTAGVISTPGGGVKPDRDATVREILDATLNFAPGSRFKYSNEGYSLLAAIIEKVSGKSYEEYLRENLFKPAGMHHTGYRLTDWSKATVARWYTGELDNGSPIERPHPNWALIGSGGILSTTEDMFRWHVALKGNVVLSEAAKAKLFKPALNDYACGWDVINSPRGLLHAHDGGNTFGVGADIKRFIDAGIFIMSFCNDSGETMLLRNTRRDIAAIVFGGEVRMPPATVRIDEKTLARYAGRYEMASSAKFTVAVRDGKLLVTPEGQEAVSAVVAISSSQSERINQLNSRAQRIIESAARGDYAALHEAFLKEVPFDQLRSRQEQLWGEWKKRLGEYRRVALIGTAPEGEEDFLTHLRVDFERGSIFLRMFWGPRRLAGFRETPVTPSRIFAPESAAEFVTYDVPTSTALRMNFKLEGNVIKSLAISANKGEVSAVRKE